MIKKHFCAKRLRMTALPPLATNARFALDECGRLSAHGRLFNKDIIPGFGVVSRFN
jgi:hypothetical protein